MVDSHHTAVSPMGCPKGIVDVDIAQLGELVAEGFDLFGIGLDLLALRVLLRALFLRVEPHILAQEHLAICFLHSADYIFSNAVI